MTLAADEFIRRFLLPALPDGADRLHPAIAAGNLFRVHTDVLVGDPLVHNSLYSLQTPTQRYPLRLVSMFTA